MVAPITAISRNSRATCCSRSSDDSAEPWSRPVMSCTWTRHCAMGSAAIAWADSRWSTLSASRAAALKRSRSRRSSSTTAWREVRSMETLRSVSDCAAALSSSAREALSRLCAVSSSSVKRARRDAAPNNAAISKNAITSSWRKEMRSSIRVLLLQTCTHAAHAAQAATAASAISTSPRRERWVA